MKFKKLFSILFTIFIVISVILFINQMDEALGIYPLEAKTSISYLPKNPEFIYLGGNSFKTVGSKPIYADDCIGCGELGDINIYHNFESIEQTDYTLNANCNGKLDVVEKGYQFNENGEKIGVRCMIVFPNGSARLFWTESPKDHFILSAPSLEILKEFEASETYKSYKLSSNK